MSIMPLPRHEKYCFVPCPPERCDCMAGRFMTDLLGDWTTFLASGTSAGTAETRNEAQGDSPQARPDAQTIDLKGIPND